MYVYANSFCLYNRKGVVNACHINIVSSYWHIHFYLCDAQSKHNKNTHCEFHNFSFCCNNQRREEKRKEHTIRLDRAINKTVISTLRRHLTKHTHIYIQYKKGVKKGRNAIHTFFAFHEIWLKMKIRKWKHEKMQTKRQNYEAIYCQNLVNLCGSKRYRLHENKWYIHS